MLVHFAFRKVVGYYFFFSSRRRHTRFDCDWSSDVCSSDLSAPDHFVLFTPFGGYRHSGDSRTWYITPLIWSHDSVQTSFATVFPLWFHHTDKALERSTTVIPPLIYVSRSDPEESFTTAALLFWRHSDIGSSTTIALPLYYDVHDYHL